jgi:preprotein translocase subunit SecB
MGPILGIACPQIIYPYLRSNVADAINRAGFPPVHLSEVNFQAMYEQQQADARNSVQNAPETNN